jgi:hypothetical protein
MSAASIIDMTLNPNTGSATWTLGVQVRLGQGIISDTLVLGLDRSLRAVPSPSDFSRTVTVGTKVGASVASAVPAVRVSENRQQIEIRLPRRLTGVRGAHFDLEVVWANPLLRAAMLEFDAEFTHMGWPVTHQPLALLNLDGADAVRSNLLSVLTTSDRRFYFPNSPALVPMRYDDFSPMTGAVQSLPGSVVWGTMWPSEVSFWHSTDGAAFLLRQAHRHSRHGERARRIAILPADGTVSPAVAGAYLIELELHHRLGVDVRLMEAAAVHAALNSSADALLCLGDSLGVYYGGIDQPIANATAGLLLDRDGIRDMRDAYDEIQRRGALWGESAIRRQLLRAPLAPLFLTARHQALGSVSLTRYLGVASTPEEVVA